MMGGSYRAIRREGLRERERWLVQPTKIFWAKDDYKENYTLRREIL